jgi:sugar phosphate isomerase/epimerase
MSGARLGGSTFSFMWQEPALAAMRRMRPIGLSEFDIIAAPGHLWPEELGSAARVELRRALEADGIRIESLNLPAIDLNLTSCVKDVRDYAVDRYTAVIRLGAELGGSGVVVVPGRISALLPPHPEDTWRWLLDSTDRLLRRAEEAGQVLHVESHPQTSIPSAESISRFLAQFETPRLMVAYDVANAEFIGENQVAAIRRLAPRIGQVHLSDSTRTTWRHDRAGLGSVDFPAIVAALDEVGYNGLRVIEVISPNPIADIEATIRAVSGRAGA